MAIMMTFKVTDVLDILVVSFIIYNLIKIMRETRAEQLVKGIIIILIAFAVSSIFNLKMLNKLFTSFFQFSVLAVLIVFQPELRSALEHIGRSKIGKYWNGFSSVNIEEAKLKQIHKCINCVVEVANNFQKSKTGALIVFERQTKLGEIIDTGTMIDAEPSVPMIGNIFFNKAPLHDGAMVIRDGKVHAAGCILPLTKNNNISTDLGTRHRAALGISENSDAVIVIVSEETGTISIAKNGIITRNYSRETLSMALEEELIPKETEKSDRIPIITGMMKGKKNERNKN
ncbi:MAG: diadenylate cyclase CdaA [Clostridia bacterium]|nr:diadenylate cyclase CdaA [Clostridia bacterium]